MDEDYIINVSFWLDCLPLKELPANAVGILFTLNLESRRNSECDGKLPCTPEGLARLARMSLDDFKELWDKYQLERFFDFDRGDDFCLPNITQESFCRGGE